jgi:hypothetical protein
MKIYLAGKITGDENYKEKFDKRAAAMTELGNAVMNPAILPAGFEYEEYMKICLSMIDAVDTVALFPDWKESSGATREHEYALENHKNIIFL